MEVRVFMVAYHNTIAVTKTQKHKTYLKYITCIKDIKLFRFFLVHSECNLMFYH